MISARTIQGPPGPSSRRNRGPDEGCEAPSVGSGAAEEPSLLIYFNGTFVGRKNGAHARTWDQLSWLSERFASVTVFSYSDHPDYPWRPADVAKFKASFPTVELVLDRQSFRQRIARRIKNLVMTIAPGLGRGVLAWRWPGATPGYEQVLRRGPRLMIVNYVDALLELNGVDPTRCLIETHDLKFMTHVKRGGASLTHLRTLGKLRSELACLGEAGGLIAIAPPEASFFKMLYPGKPVWYVPQYPVPRPEPSKSRPTRWDMLFVGSENAFNREGLTRFFSECGWARDYSIAVVGRVCEADSVKEAAARLPKVELLGFVEDLGETYARSKLVISPVDGTGMKIKAIEALAAGKPVLASAHTLAGLPAGSEGCVFPLTAEAALELTTRADRLEEAGRKAAAYAASLAKAGDALELAAYVEERLREARRAPESRIVPEASTSTVVG